MPATTGTLNQETSFAFVFPKIVGGLYPLAGVVLFGTAIAAAGIVALVALQIGSNFPAPTEYNEAKPAVVAPAPLVANPFGTLSLPPDLFASDQSVEPGPSLSGLLSPAAPKVATEQPPAVVQQTAPTVAPLRPEHLAQIAPRVPLPPPRPSLLRPHVDPEAVEEPVPETAPITAARVAAAGPPPDERNLLQKLFNFPRQPAIAALPGVDPFTAVYDVSDHVVYMPDGEKLQAHSGLGNFMDDPRHVDAKDRGALPPNTYDLTPREQIFHGVQALRLIPVGNGIMYGRTGLLAHSYMLGANGQSNGCLSFQDYPDFLQAFREGKVKHLLVMAHLT